MDFQLRFQGKLSTIKKDGITAIISKTGLPIEKLNKSQDGIYYVE